MYPPAESATGATYAQTEGTQRAANVDAAVAMVAAPAAATTAGTY